MPTPRNREFVLPSYVSEDDNGLIGLCRDGRPHQFDGVECSGCGEVPDNEDRPERWHPEDADHACFSGCRHLSHGRRNG